jgi:hypothetical protein
VPARAISTANMLTAPPGSPNEDGTSPFSSGFLDGGFSHAHRNRAR